MLSTLLCAQHGNMFLWHFTELRIRCIDLADAWRSFSPQNPLIHMFACPTKAIAFWSRHSFAVWFWGLIVSYDRNLYLVCFKLSKENPIWKALSNHSPYYFKKHKDWKTTFPLKPSPMISICELLVFAIQKIQKKPCLDVSFIEWEKHPEIFTYIYNIINSYHVNLFGSLLQFHSPKKKIPFIRINTRLTMGFLNHSWPYWLWLVGLENCFNDTFSWPQFRKLVFFLVDIGNCCMFGDLLLTKYEILVHPRSLTTTPLKNEGWNMILFFFGMAYSQGQTVKLPGGMSMFGVWTLNMTPGWFIYIMHDLVSGY